MFRAMIKPRFFATVPCLASPFVSTHPIFFSFAIARPLVFSCFSTHFPYGDIVSPGLFVFDLLLEACWLVDRSLLNPLFRVASTHCYARTAAFVLLFFLLRSAIFVWLGDLRLGRLSCSCAFCCNPFCPINLPRSPYSKL